MRRCPRCRSTMLFEFGGMDGVFERAWKCVGCGRELLADAVKQAQDDELLGRIRGDSTQQRNM